ncbi:Ltp family lipoprotein [Rhodoluna limnophila]|uniref:Ltp family lipoprotein n=1 Tax=Rhodoluna limnophila TaxID=232537 RepID=UPI001FEF2934|nr:Ltp family lipoprotein [Rhodoluna limnophila]
MSDQSNDPKIAKADAKAAKARAKALRPWFQKKRFILPIALVLLIGISTSMNGGNSDPLPIASTNSEDSSSITEESTTTEVEEAPTETVNQENARKSAESYLEYSAFSRQGLIDQLEYEEFATEDAEYAVDAVGADWNEQAAKSAESYLEYSSFSKQGLIDQLVYEGFTQAQAEYGVSTTGLK